MGASARVGPVLDRSGLDDPTQRIQVGDVRGGGDGDGRAPVGLADDEALDGEQGEGLPDSVAGEAERLGDRLLDEVRARAQMAVDDLAAQDLGDLLCRRRGA